MEREHFDLVWRFHANILGGSRIFTDLLVHQKRVRSLLNWSMGSRRSSPFSIISTGEEGTKRRRKKKKMERRREKTTSNELIIQMTRSLPVPCRGMWGENAHHLPPPTKIVIRVHAKTIKSEWIWKKMEIFKWAIISTRCGLYRDLCYLGNVCVTTLVKEGTDPLTCLSFASSFQLGGWGTWEAANEHQTNAQAVNRFGAKVVNLFVIKTKDKGVFIDGGWDGECANRWPKIALQEKIAVIKTWLRRQTKRFVLCKLILWWIYIFCLFARWIIR